MSVTIHTNGQSSHPSDGIYSTAIATFDFDSFRPYAESAMRTNTRRDFVRNDVSDVLLDFAE